MHVVAVYIATRDPELRARLDTRQRELVAAEVATEFDPTRNPDDLRRLEEIIADR